MEEGGQRKNLGALKGPSYLEKCKKGGRKLIEGEKAYQRDRDTDGKVKG